MQTFNYMLRKTLIPWRMQETIGEVLEYCKANHVHEVMWKIDAESFNKGFTSNEYIQEFLPALKTAKALFDKEGITTSINPWMTLNHADYGRDSRAQFPEFGWMVDYTGTQSKSCACPLSQAWQNHLQQSYALYATVKPAILWVEDDFRTFNHNPVNWGCFCNEHMAAFSRLAGERLTRDELVECILRPGKAHPYRALWMDMLGETMIKVAKAISSSVHAVSPETRVALMCSLPDDHSIEGRRWNELMAALSADHKPVCRPHYGAYRHERMADIYTGIDICRQTAYCLPPDTRLCPEVENAPFTEFVKSVKYTRFQILLSAAMGNADVTLNLYDHVGTPINPDDQFGRMLRDTYPYASGLLEHCGPNPRYSGIRLPFNCTIAKKARTTAGQEFTELYGNGSGWSMALQSLGFSVTFQQAPIVALTGQASRGFGRQEILSMLSGGVLLDLSAAQTLVHDGYGEYIGVEVKSIIRKNDVPIAAEDLGNGTYISPRLATDKEILGRISPAPGAIAASNFIDYNKEIFMPAMVKFENSLGGRVATFAMDMHNGVRCCFMSWHRKQQFAEIISWLGRGHVPAFVSGGPNAVPIRLDYDDRTILIVGNNSPDTWENVSAEIFTGDRRVKGVLVAMPTGTWTQMPGEFTISNGTLKLACPSKLNYLDIMVFCVQYKA